MRVIINPDMTHFTVSIPKYYRVHYLTAPKVYNGTLDMKGNCVSKM